MDHLRFAGLPFQSQAAALESILRGDQMVWPAISFARSIALPDWLIVSGAIYNSVWNALTGKPAGYGTKDIDLFYHDGSDLSWEAEDAIIRRSQDGACKLGLPLEVRNQARVHLWFPERFGHVCPRYATSAHALRYFASETHAVGVRLEKNDCLTIEAPFGLDHIFSFVLAPNRVMDNRAAHDAKSARAATMWPELTIVPW